MVTRDFALVLRNKDGSFFSSIRQLAEGADVWFDRFRRDAMELELQKYEYHNQEYLVYDCNRNHYKFGAREARVMCSQSVGLTIQKIIVGPIIQENAEMSLLLYNPDGTRAEPQAEDILVFSKYLEEAGYERTPRSSSGQISPEDVRRVCKMAFFEKFVEKYNLKEA